MSDWQAATVGATITLVILAIAGAAFWGLLWIGTQIANPWGPLLVTSIVVWVIVFLTIKYGD